MPVEGIQTDSGVTGLTRKRAFSIAGRPLIVSVMIRLPADLKNMR